MTERNRSHASGATRLVLLLVTALGLALSASPAAAEGEVIRKCPDDFVALVRGSLGAAVSSTADMYCRVTETPRIVVGTEETPANKVTSSGEVALVDGRIATVHIKDGQIAGISYSHSDMTGSSGPLLALLFWVFAIASVAGAVFVITRRNLIAAVMGMVGSFLGIAAIYMMLYAQFLAVVQMLVYAGAIMVLFVFVVMILNRPEDEPVAPTGRAGQALGGIAILYLVARLILMLMRVEPPDLALANAAPAVTAEGFDWGSVRAVGTDLFGPGLFPFEAISLLLLVAVVGAIAIARPLHADEDDKANAEGGAA